MSSNAQDVMGKAQHYEEVKKEVDVTTLNDIAKGEFRIESMKMKDSKKGEVVWECKDWDLTNN